ncbi:hypothetical protein EVAR_85120_1 [Eumeta japonica]|uniref:Uncharacterized protein n=1 Tax=Eumeta variegata TaxID=151549 RepID=A0A4C1XS80_EUMVA|nr:hypothetical protein EVAR_85120_1 [Eumeta japonica]
MSLKVQSAMAYGSQVLGAANRGKYAYAHKKRYQMEQRRGLLYTIRYPVCSAYLTDLLNILLTYVIFMIMRMIVLWTLYTSAILTSSQNRVDECRSQLVSDIETALAQTVELNSQKNTTMRV